VLRGKVETIENISSL